jgi:Protein of unknown function (DUF2934)
MNLSHTNELSKNTEALRFKIEERAYELYEQRGRQNGFALQDWLQAEQELTWAAEDRPAEKFFVSKAI